MFGLQSKIAIKINPKVYKKDPLSSDLGMQIVSGGIELMEQLGYENFTFRKLANKIDSTEASIYRYFDNKRNLLAYLTMWYWSWMQYRVTMMTLNIEDPKIRLEKAIRCITMKVEEDQDFQEINEAKLNQIVNRDSAKVYHCKNVQKDNREGFFLAYKDFVEGLAQIILEIRPEFKYPHMLVTTIIEGAHHQRFFAEHLPRLTDVIDGEDAISNFYLEMVKRELKIEKQ